MSKFLLVDHQKCTGCRLCEMVCSVKHTGCSNPSRARIHVVKWESQGIEFPMACQQCEDAPCMAVCPKEALKRDEKLGRVVVDYEACIGCKLCVAACPFGGMGIDVVAKQVVKCDLCEGEPLCAGFCQPQAITYVEASTANLRKKRDIGSKLSELVKKLSPV